MIAEGHLPMIGCFGLGASFAEAARREAQEFGHHPEVISRAREIMVTTLVESYADALIQACQETNRERWLDDACPGITR